MSIYLWIAASGVIGLVAILVFVSTLLKDKKLKKGLGYPARVVVPNYFLLILSISSFSLMVYLFVLIKDQLVELGG